MKKAALFMIIALTISVFANAQTRVEIKSADLPKAITENLTKDFNGFTLHKAFKVTTNNQSTFELIVVKGTDREKLEYSSAGAFVKKTAIVPPAKPAAEAKSAPATKPATGVKSAPATKPATEVKQAPAAKPAAPAKPTSEVKQEPAKK
jgi:hypothetical protein